LQVLFSINILIIQYSFLTPLSFARLL
jgi:hypothetical protein